MTVLRSFLQLNCTRSGVSSKLGFCCRKIMLILLFQPAICHEDNVPPENCPFALAKVSNQILLATTATGISALNVEQNQSGQVDG